MHLFAQLLGSLIVVGSAVLIAVFGPRIMYGQSWRAEMIDYQVDRAIEVATTDALNKAAANIDRCASLSNLSANDFKYMVEQYTDATLPNATVLVAPGSKFNERWNESNARGALLESALLADNDLVIFPNNFSLFICTVVSMFMILAATIICTSMVATYQQILMRVFYYITPLKSRVAIDTPLYNHTALAREVILLALSVLFALFTLAQACVFGWLESDKKWTFGQSAFWGALLFTGVSHSPVKPPYMQGIPQMTTWLSLCHFCMCLHTSASLGLVIITALRCIQAGDVPKNLPLSDKEIRFAMKIDHERVTVRDVNRPLYHH